MKLLTVKQTAAQLEVSVRTIQRKIDSGDLGCIRDGRLVRISEDQIATFLAERTFNPSPLSPQQMRRVLRPRGPRIRHQGTSHLKPL